MKTAIVHHIYRQVQIDDRVLTDVLQRVVFNPTLQSSHWRKPTVDDGTVSTLDKIRGAPAVVIV